MTTLPNVTLVRELIHKTFCDLGVHEEEAPRETILIQDGHFCGRRFSNDFSKAVWFFEENEIKFYDADGSLLKVLIPNVNEQVVAKRAA